MWLTQLKAPTNLIPRLGSSEGDFYILKCEAYIYEYIYIIIYKLVKSETKFDCRYYGR